MCKIYKIMSNSTNETPAIHGFLMIGTTKLFLCHLPMFFMPVHSYQVILQADIPEEDMKTYVKTKNENPNKPIIHQLAYVF